MKKDHFPFMQGTLMQMCFNMKHISNRLLSISIFLGLVLYVQETSGQVNWGNATPPSSMETLKDLGDVGKIYKTTWSGSNTLENSEQTLHMAELDFFNTPTRDYELKIAYIYNDPYKLPNMIPVDPAECKEVCYYITCTSGPECVNGLQRFCEPVPGGQFDFVSHIAAKHGAVMATNGAFYDYFYNCVPGVKSYIKIDGHEFSKPNILNHRNEGALAFDFNGVTPKIDIFQRTAKTLEDLDNGNLYHSTIPGHNISSYSNVMSGGHLNDNPDITPYVLNAPDFCNDILYPWSNDTKYTGADDILKKSGGTWRNFACPTIPRTGEVDIPLQPTTYGYQDFFKCSNLNDLQKRKQLTCVDYAKFGEEFGGTDGLAKRSRTFIAMKGQKLYWFVADGATKCKKPNGEIVPPNECAAGDSRVKGFTIGELDKFARDMGFEKMLNFDGGSSSAFYLNGKGILQFQYDPNAPASNKRVGPQAQRLLQSVLMLVPRKKPLNDVYREKLSHVVVENTNSDMKSFIDLSPAVDKVNNGAGVFGRFKTDVLIDYDKSNTSPGLHNYGRILYSMVKDENKSLNEAVIAGVGSIPNKLHQLLQTQVSLHSEIGGVTKAEFDAFLAENSFYYWAFKIEKGKFVAYDIYPRTNDSYDILSSTPRPFDGEWHDFMLMGNGYNYDCFSCGKDNLYSSEFGLWFDDWPGMFNHSIKGSVKERELELGSLFVPNATNVSVGAMVNNGEYITSTHDDRKIFFQDFVFTDNFDNYYGYNDNEIAAGREYGDPSKEYKYLRSKDWNSSFYDEMHHNETSGDDGNTIFCFDERSGSKIAYAWYRGGREGGDRELKTYGVYVGSAHTVSEDRERRSVEVGTEIPRALYHIVNEENGLKLNAFHNPDSNQGTVYLKNDESISIGKTNKFLVERMGEERFLISNTGVYVLKGGGSLVQTNLGFSPDDLQNYWDIQPGLSPGVFTIKCRQSGKYLTGGSEGVNVSLTDFTNAKNQQWFFEKTEEVKDIVMPNYYELQIYDTNLRNHNSLFMVGASGSGSTEGDIGKMLIDYVGAGFYYIRAKDKGEDQEFKVDMAATDVNSDLALSLLVNSPLLVHSQKLESSKPKTNLFAVTFGQNENEVGFYRYFMGDSKFEKFGVSVIENYGILKMKRGISPSLFSLVKMEKFSKLTPDHYGISSLENQDLLAKRSGYNTSYAKAIQEEQGASNAWDFHDIGLGKYLVFSPDERFFSTVDETNNKWEVNLDYSGRKAFEVVINDDGSSTLKYGEQCLTDKGTGNEYEFSSCTSGNNQKFLLYQNNYHEFNEIVRGFYRIVNKNSKLVLKSFQGMGYDVRQNNYIDDDNFDDEWLLEPMGDGEYMISNRASFKSLDVKGGSTENHANIQTYSVNKTKAQRWVINRNGDYYQIKSVVSGKCMDVDGASTDANANIKQLFCRSLTDQYVGAQQFAIDLVEDASPPIEEGIDYTFHNVIDGRKAGIFPVSFDENEWIGVGEFGHKNKSDLWSFEYQGAQLYTIKSKSTGKHLSVRANNTGIPKDAILRTFPSNSVNSDMMWALTDNYKGNETDNGEYTIVNPSPELTLQTLAIIPFIVFNHIDTSDNNSGVWKLTSVKEPEFEGFYRFRPKVPKTAVDDFALGFNPVHDESLVVQFRSWFDDSVWKLDKLEDGYYRFIHKVHTDKVISAGNLTTDDVKAVTWNINDNKQRWSIEKISDGAPFYRIINKSTSLAMYWSYLDVFIPTETVSWVDSDERFIWNITKESGSSLSSKKIKNPLKEEREEELVMEREEELVMEQFAAYPNPSQGNINVDLSLFKDKDFETLRFNFYDLSGRLLHGDVREVNIRQNPNVSFERLNFRGYVILNITDSNGKVLGSKKLIFR